MIRRKIMVLFFAGALLFSAVSACSSEEAEKAEEKPPAKTEPQQEGLPAIIADGLNAYKQSGPEAAIKVWIKGSPMEKKDKTGAISGYAKSFEDIEKYYGPFRSHHLIETKEITPLSRLVTLGMNFEQGPLFARFMIYKGEKGWLIVTLDFNTSPEAILPGLLLK